MKSSTPRAIQIPTMVSYGSPAGLSDENGAFSGDNSFGFEGSGETEIDIALLDIGISGIIDRTSTGAAVIDTVIVRAIHKMKNGAKFAMR